jgi:hypothetical protein
MILDLDYSAKGTNNLMYQNDLKIQKGLKNKVRIQFKNSDQKRIKIYNTQTFIFSMFDNVNNMLMFEKPLEILDDNTTSTRGLAQLTLSESDTLSLYRSTYKYSIKLKDQDGSFVPAYANTYYGVSGILHLDNDVEPLFKESIEIKTFSKVFNSDIQKYEYKSENIYAEPEFNTNSSVHTMAIYLTAFKGKIFLEATLDNDPGVNANYSIIYSKQYSDFTGIDPVTFSGVFSYVRIRYIPDTAPGEPNNDNPAYFGSLDKILYRS